MTVSTVHRASFDSPMALKSFLFDADECTSVQPGLDLHFDHARCFKIRAANSLGERNSASVLIEKMYATRGYRTTPLPEEALPHLLTLVASDYGATIGTLTIGFDGDTGLLADELFPDEVQALRDAGQQVCEFTKLAMDSVVRSKRVLATLFNVAFLYAHRIKGAQSLLIEVNPRHTRFYERTLGFKSVGPKRLNHRVNAPAVLMSIDLNHVSRQICEFGGRPELAETERALYPFAFSPAEEAGILSRLHKVNFDADEEFAVERGPADDGVPQIPEGRDAIILGMLHGMRLLAGPAAVSA